MNEIVYWYIIYSLIAIVAWIFAYSISKTKYFQKRVLLSSIKDPYRLERRHLFIEEYTKEYGALSR